MLGNLNYTGNQWKNIGIPWDRKKPISITSKNSFTAIVMGQIIKFIISIKHNTPGMQWGFGNGTS